MKIKYTYLYSVIFLLLQPLPAQSHALIKLCNGPIELKESQFQPEKAMDVYVTLWSGRTNVENRNKPRELVGKYIIDGKRGDRKCHTIEVESKKEKDITYYYYYYWTEELAELHTQFLKQNMQPATRLQVGDSGTGLADWHSESIIDFEPVVDLSRTPGAYDDMIEYHTVQIDVSGKINHNSKAW